MIFAKLQLWALLLLSLTSAFRYEPTSELLDDKIFYPKLIEVAKQAVENYNKFKTAFEYQQHLFRESNGYQMAKENVQNSAPRFASVEAKNTLTGNVDDKKMIHESLYDTQIRRGPPPLTLYVDQFGGPLTPEEEVAAAEGQLRVLEKKNEVAIQNFEREVYKENQNEELERQKEQAQRSLETLPIPKAAIIEAGLEFSDVTPAPPYRMVIQKGGSSSYYTIPPKQQPSKAVQSSQEKKADVKMNALKPTQGPECIQLPGE